MKPATGATAGTRAAVQRPAIILIGILLAGAAIHLPYLGGPSLWLDEALTLVPVVRADSLRSLVVFVRTYDTQPPLSHLLLYLLRGALPAGEFGYRLPSFVAMQAGLVFLFLLARRVWGARTALAAVALAEISPYISWYAAEARNYGLWFMAVCASWWLLVRWSVNPATDAAKPRPGALAVAAWGVANGLGLLIHLFHVFSIVTQCVVVAALARAAPAGAPRRRLLGAAAAGTLLALFVFAPWLPELLSPLAPGVPGVGWTRTATVSTLAPLPYALVFGFSWGPGLREAHIDDLRTLMLRHAAALAAAALALALVGLAALWMCARRGGGRAPGTPGAEDAGIDATIADRLAFLLVPTAGLVAPLACAVTTHFPLHPRHLMYLEPLVPLLLARLLVLGGAARWAAAPAILIQACALWNLQMTPVYAKDDTRGAVRYAEEHSPGAACIVGDTAPLYVTRVTGLQDWYDDLRDTRRCDGIADLWWVENRPWEDPGGRVLRRLERIAEARGLLAADSIDRFTGVTLRHWTQPPAGKPAP